MYMRIRDQFPSNLFKAMLALLTIALLSGCTMETRPNAPDCNDPGYSAQACN